jgi:hypothetical protein
MTIAAKSLKEFVETAKSGTFGYNPEVKARWHRLARRVAKALAERMGMDPSEYDIRHNRGGIAVCGETYLHSDWLYLDLSVSCLGPDMGFMFRSCTSRKDYTGGVNCWMQWDTLSV